MQEFKYRIVYVNENVVFQIKRKKALPLKLNDVISYAVQRMMVKGVFPEKTEFAETPNLEFFLA